MLRPADAQQAHSITHARMKKVRDAASTDDLAQKVFAKRQAVLAQRRAKEEDRAGEAREAQRQMYARRACGV